MSLSLLTLRPASPLHRHVLLFPLSEVCALEQLDKAQRYEIAFLELTLANQDQPALVSLFLKRRLLERPKNKNSH